MQLADKIPFTNKHKITLGRVPGAGGQSLEARDPPAGEESPCIDNGQPVKLYIAKTGCIRRIHKEVVKCLN